jgi:hypothetical protein
MAHFQEDHLHHLTGVVYPALEALDGRTPVQLTFQRADNIASWTMPVSTSSLQILLSQDLQTIQNLEAKISQLEFSNNSYIKKAEDDRKEIKRLEEVCRKWYAEVQQRDATIKSTRDSLLAFSTESETRGREIQRLEKEIVGWCAGMQVDKTTIRNLKTELDLKKGQIHQMEKTIMPTYEHMKTKFEQATKEAKKWKETATTRANEIDRLANLVIQRTNERNVALGKPEQAAPYPGATITFGNSEPIPVKDLKITAGKATVAKPSAQLKELPTVTATFKWDQGWGLPATIAGPTLVDRVSTLEAKVEKLEKPAVQQYRLLDPSEIVAEGDEWYVRDSDSWRLTTCAGSTQQTKTVYRRKM